MNTPGLDRYTKLVLVHKGHFGTPQQVNSVLTHGLLDNFTTAVIQRTEDYVAQLDHAEIAKLVVFGCPGDMDPVLRNVLDRLDRQVRDLYEFTF